MAAQFLFVVVLILAGFGYWYGRKRIVTLVGGRERELHSLPAYHGSYVAIWCGLPAIILAAFWLIFQPILVDGILVDSLPPDYHSLSDAELNLVMNDIRNLARNDVVSQEPDPVIQKAAARLISLHQTGNAIMWLVVLVVAMFGLAWGRTRLASQFRARNRVERVVGIILIISSTIAILTTVGIVLSLLFESVLFFGKISVTEFLFGTEWSPQTALRADQVGASGAFGAIPLFAGTFLITLIAMTVAVPIGLMSAIYLADYASLRVRSIVKPVLEILAGVPTVVYGFFAAITIAPEIRGLGESIGLSVASESALAAGLVMGIMIIPFVSSLSDDIINAVPQSLRDGSYGLGATKSETIRKVLLPAALPGIVGAVLLAVSRAIGETMIVVMAAGLAANLTANPLEAVTTVTVQIVTLLVGDQEFDSAKTLAAFALGLVLFVITLALNYVALRVVQKYREAYE